jgi:CRISPR-associated endonuclease Csy4
MKFYQDIALLSGAEIDPGFLWQKLYQHVHLALVEHKVGENLSSIAVGFPGYGQKCFPLGLTLRLYATSQNTLEKLDIEQYLARISDYVRVTSVKAITGVTGHVSFVRHHAKGEGRIERDEQDKAQRWSAKTGKPYGECLEALAKTRPKADSKLPFIWVESLGGKRITPVSSRKFPLFIKMMEFEAEHEGAVSCYGLSNPKNLVTVPKF